MADEKPTTRDSAAALEAVLEICGGRSNTAREASKFSLDGKRLPATTLHGMIEAGRASPSWVIPLEKACGGLVTRYELRPDLYPIDDLGPPHAVERLREALSA